jgi:hypothetical protein
MRHFSEFDSPAVHRMPNPPFSPEEDHTFSIFFRSRTSMDPDAHWNPAQMIGPIAYLCISTISLPIKPVHLLSLKKIKFFTCVLFGNSYTQGNYRKCPLYDYTQWMFLLQKRHLTQEFYFRILLIIL